MNAVALFRGASAAFAAALTFALCGCGGGATDSLPREAVYGTVTLDGKPLEGGSIAFDPDAQGQANPVSVGGNIIGGSYSISKADGPTPGKYRVSIYDAGADGGLAPGEAPGAPAKKTKASSVPAKYNANTTLSAEIKAGSSNKYDFTLTSK
jgi:hypothetical protein